MANRHQQTYRPSFENMEFVKKSQSSFLELDESRIILLSLSCIAVYINPKYQEAQSTIKVNQKKDESDMYTLKSSTERIMLLIPIVASTLGI